MELYCTWRITGTWRCMLNLQKVRWILCRYFFFSGNSRNCYFKTYNEEILGEDVIKWINIDEIKDAVECDDDGREHDYEMFPAQLYVTDIKCDPENGETEYSLKSKTIKVDYANKDDDERLFDAAKRRVPVVAEFKYVGRELHIRNVKIVEREDES